MTHEEEAYLRALNARGASIRSLDIDVFADGVMAHRMGREFHENPHGGIDARTIKRLSWSMGWNERALQKGR